MKTNQAALLTCFLVALLASPVAAATVRGRIDRVTKMGTAPAASIPVTLRSRSAGRSYPAYSDSSGLYYLYNVPPGSYTLEIWVSKSPRVYNVTVPAVPRYDVAPIRVR